MSELKEENLTLCIRIASERTCPVWGHHQDTLFKPLDEVVEYALAIARSDPDWLPWKIYLTNAGVIWKSEPSWNRGQIIKDLEKFINAI